MKKLQIVFLFVFLAGCSSNQNALPTITPNIAQTPSPFPAQTAIPPTQTLTSTSTFTPTPTQTPIGGGAGKIAFTSNRDGVTDIYVMNSDGSNLIQLSNDITPKYSPDWSPDSRKIAFASNHDDSAGIYIMNADGTNPAKLIDTKEVNQSGLVWRFVIDCCRPVWSPNGEKIAFVSFHYVNCCFSYSNIYVINADGSNLISAANHSAHDNEPAWSPDSQKIAFDSAVDWQKTAFDSNSCGGSSGSLCLMNADGTDSHPINENGGAPIWSPDGKKIAFSSGQDGNGEVYVMNADGANPINLTHYNRGMDSHPIWSPDGKKIAFSSYRDGNWEIYVMNADGTNPFNLTNNQAGDSDPVWSPDSQKIAFVSERDGNSEIYMMNADGSNPVRLTNNKANDYSPVWSP